MEDITVEHWVMILWIVNAILTVYLYDRWDGICDTIQSSMGYRINGWKAKWLVHPITYTAIRSEDIPFRSYFGGWWKIATWYYDKFNIKHMEKFPLSSTLFVCFTDRWHLYKMLKSRLIDVQITLAFITCFPIYWKWFLLLPIALFIARSIGFHQTFRK